MKTDHQNQIGRPVIIYRSDLNRMDKHGAHAQISVVSQLLPSLDCNLAQWVDFSFGEFTFLHSKKRDLSYMNLKLRHLELTWFEALGKYGFGHQCWE